MKPFLSALLLIAALSTLIGCVTEERSGGDSPYTLDTASVFSNGERKPRIPKVVYKARDTLFLIDVYGLEYGDEKNVWIWRNESLLDQPSNMGPVQGKYQYRLADTLTKPGRYVYYVQYGTRAGFLGGKSPEYIYDFPGHSRSGIVDLEYGEDQLVQIRLSNAPEDLISQAYFERRIGAQGKTEVLDTLFKSGGYNLALVDTAFIPLDTVVHYRAVAMDAFTETWLDPTPWDSVRIRNRTWTYAPYPDYTNLGMEVRVKVDYPLKYSGKAFYYLYRNTSSSRRGKVKVDSLPMDGSPSTKPLQDAVAEPGSYYYWVEAQDPYGRTSARSTPQELVFTGNYRGPEIRSTIDYTSVVYIETSLHHAASAYILQRAADTTDAVTDVDTLRTADAGSFPSFSDFPPGEGYWFYRIMVIVNGKPSDPGEWFKTGFLRLEPYYQRIESPIFNRGVAGVEVSILPYSGARFFLYRKAQATAGDSIVVDSLVDGDGNDRLSDKPPLGTWYYRVYRQVKPFGSSHTIGRSDQVRIDFTGKPVGPPITSLILNGGGIDVVLITDPEALAYVLERSPDTSESWTVADTVSSQVSNKQTLSDRPPRNGFWSYRVRTLTRSFALTDAGPPALTPQSWSYRVSYENTLVATIANRGPHVESNLASTSYGFYLKRSVAADYSDPFLVDSVEASDTGPRLLKDVPANGVWFYWVESKTSTGTAGSIARTPPIRVQFTGAPEVISLSKHLSSLSHGVDIFYSTPALGDTVEIWKSDGKADDLASYELIRKDGAGSAYYYTDQSVDAKAPAFYHYRLVLKTGGTSTGRGPAKSIYYQPD
ncbi:MAG: hypothetical protein M3Y08_01910 [Fibrobacterota bacterium]|nr:hypothetical protein [Fibrobacterota bacterium]